MRLPMRAIGYMLVAWTATCAMYADAQSIVSVDMREEGEPLPELARGLQERQLVKFMDEMQLSGDVVYDTLWEAPTAGLRGSVTMVMAYRQAGSREVRRLIVQYPDGTAGRQIARFRIRADQLEEWGGVTAWHIQVRQGGRVLDERKSGRWR